MAGQEPGLVSAPVERQARFIDLASFEHQPFDRLAIGGALGLPLGGLVVVAALAQQVILELDQQPGHLVVEPRGGETARVGSRPGHQRPSERGGFIVEGLQEALPGEGRMDPLIVRGTLEDDRPEQLARDGAWQLVRPELVDHP